MSDRLRSWTRTLNQDDAFDLLLEAKPGQRIEAWEDRSHAMLPQPSRDRRQETVRMVRDLFLDVHEGAIVPSAWLRLFQEGSPRRRHDLFHARMHAERPWILRAMDQVILPRLALCDEPLAPRDAAIVSPEEWAAFFDRNLLETTRPESVKKTRTTVLRHLGQLGVLASDSDLDRSGLDGAFSLAREGRAMTRVQHAEPDPLAFAWLLRQELLRDRRTEAAETWAGDGSVASRVFATRRAYAARCVDAGIAAGFLRRGYLAGAPRLHPVAEALPVPSVTDRLAWEDRA
jgi:hypothetical protein